MSTLQEYYYVVQEAVTWEHCGCVGVGEGGGGRGEGFAERINILDSEDVVEDGVLPSRLSFLHMFSLPPMYAGLSSTLATYCEREREHTKMHLTQRYIGTFA